jgi:flagellar biosynthesis protein FliR
MIWLVLALRGAAAVGVLVALVGGLPWIVQAGLALAVGLWSAVVVGGTAPAGLDDALWLGAAYELVIGAAIGVIGSVPLLAAAMAGRLVDGASGARTRGPYSALFGILAAAVFVGIDGHVAFVSAIATNFRDVPPLVPPLGMATALATSEPRVLATVAALVPVAVRLAIPWLVAAAVVEIAAGVAMRLAGRAGQHGPIGAAAPAALVMLTASLIGTLAVAIATVVRGVW